MFLSPDELQQLTGYAPNQRARIRRWLDKNGIAHKINRLGDPVVLRAAIETPANTDSQPNFEFLKRTA